MDNQIIIGIGGTSRSGKSALAKKINEYYQTKQNQVCLIKQDDLVCEEKDIPLIKSEVDWEHPDSMDFDGQLNLIMKKKGLYQVLIIEGILAFYDERINQLYDVRILCEIDKFNFLRRKRKDFRWGLHDNWYIEHIWDSYHKFGRSILSHPNQTWRQKLIYIFNHAYDNRLLDLIERIEGKE
jgi:uridine kinase